MTVEILDWPENLSSVTARSFRLVSRSLQSTSLLSSEVRTAGPTAQRFVAALSFPPRNQVEWRQADGLLTSLRGMSGFLRLGDPAKSEPLFNSLVAETTETWDDATTWDDGAGWASGKLPAFVAAKAAASRGERSMVLQSLPVSTTAVLRPGDLFEVRPNGVPAQHGHMYLVTRQANTDANGETRVTFEPGLRTGVAPGDMIVLTEPKSVFRLIDDEQGEIEVDNTYIGHMGLSLVEVLPAN